DVGALDVQLLADVTDDARHPLKPLADRSLGDRKNLIFDEADAPLHAERLGDVPDVLVELEAPRGPIGLLVRDVEQRCGAGHASPVVDSPRIVLGVAVQLPPPLGIGVLGPPVRATATARRPLRRIAADAAAAGLPWHHGAETRV